MCTYSKPIILGQSPHPLIYTYNLASLRRVMVMLYFVQLKHVLLP